MNRHALSIFGYIALGFAGFIDKFTGSGGIDALSAALGPMAPVVAVALPILSHMLVSGVNAAPAAKNFVFIFCVFTVLTSMSACHTVQDATANFLGVPSTTPPAVLTSDMACYLQSVANAGNETLNVTGSGNSSLAKDLQDASIIAGQACGAPLPVKVILPPVT